MHYRSIDSDWDEPDGWGKYTIPFLNTLHPITGNLVEHAVRVRHCHAEEVVRQFIYKADRQIRRILESSPRHNAHEFRIENYSASEIARIAGYVRNVVRLFTMYYQTNDENRESDSLKCIEMSVANLADVLMRIDRAVEDKLSPLCGNEEARQDIMNLVALMNMVEAASTYEASD